MHIKLTVFFKEPFWVGVFERVDDGMIEIREEKKVNPKRLRRIVKKEISKSGVGTKAQQAMKLEHGLKKVEKKQTSKEKRDELKQIKFEMKQKKRKIKKGAIELNKGSSLSRI